MHFNHVKIIIFYIFHIKNLGKTFLILTRVANIAILVSILTFRPNELT
jgi:hypothetical protein